ncbi:hypothetical protein ACTJIJ_19800 [Niabella sp. 22666]|uniref:hypothetical protein n=1 Tax=Niabella sp. 22666 TaxID=3453954 RepID=UPI003F8648E5
MKNDVVYSAVFDIKSKIKVACMYKLSPYIISRIEDNPSVKLDIAKVLSRSEQVVKRLLKGNDVNSDLTKVAVVKLLEVEFGIKECRIIILEKPKNPKKSLEKIGMLNKC